MSVLDPVLNPLLNLQPIWVIIIISLSITVIMTFIYKLLTNQVLMKSLKDEMKHLQKEVKEFGKHPEKLAAAQKKIMSKNMEYMKHSMKPTLVTMIPILLIIGWLSAHLSYYPLVPGMAFDVNVTADLQELTIEAKNLTIIGNITQFSETGEFSWKAKAAEKGEYIIGFSSEDTYAEKKIVISDRQEYELPVERVKNSKIQYITIGNKKLHP
ncbi:DUF106 domain-containing protein, partial [Candidatus Woesearchaeota archaeon]|nr:DUF106 domain-containing protein [Candidatus Woesearchaeota archaeon]